MKPALIALASMTVASLASAQASPTRVQITGSANCVILVGEEFRIDSDKQELTPAELAGLVRGNTLELTDGNFVVHLPRLTALRVDGESNVAVSNLRSGYFEASVRGQSNVAIQGTADYFHLKSFGENNVAAEGFRARNLFVHANGPSNVAAKGSALNVYLTALGNAKIAAEMPGAKQLATSESEGSNIVYEVEDDDFDR